MPQTCTICRHKSREDIECALIERTPFRYIAAQHAVSASALVRHFDDHLPDALPKAKDVEDAAHADTILGQVQDLRDRAMKILDDAETKRDFRNALAAIREARGCLELLGKLAGKLAEGATVNILVTAEWQAVQMSLIDALSPYPDARIAVAAALGRLETPHAPGHA